MPPWYPAGFDLFASQVVPILRRRGLFRHDYAGRILREHYGMPRPRSLYADAARASARRLAVSRAGAGRIFRDPRSHRRPDAVRADFA